MGETEHHTPHDVRIPPRGRSPIPRGTRGRKLQRTTSNRSRPYGGQRGGNRKKKTKKKYNYNKKTKKKKSKSIKKKKKSKSIKKKKKSLKKKK